MLLAEILEQKKNVEEKIRVLEGYLFNLASEHENQDTVKIDETVTEIYLLLDEVQKKLFTIDRANHSIKLKIGSSEVSLSDAIRLRKTIKMKIDILSGLIESCKCNKNSKFSMQDLLNNKDKLLVEFNILTKAIKSKDWTIDLGE